MRARLGGVSSSCRVSVRRARAIPKPLASASASARRRKRFIKVTGLPLDVTEEKLKVLVERLKQQQKKNAQATQGQHRPGNGNKDSVLHAEHVDHVQVEVEVDKNLLGVCESGEALVKLVWEAEEGDLQPQQMDTAALKVCDLLMSKEAFAGTKGEGLEQVDVVASAVDEGDQQALQVGNAIKTKTSTYLNRLSLEQYKKERESIEEEFKHFENTSY